MIRVVIDDERTLPFFDALHLRTSDEALAYIARLWTTQWGPNSYGEAIDELYLDHDLGGSDTIKPVVDFLVAVSVMARPLLVKRLFVHSQNPIGADKIYKDLFPHYEKVYRIGIPRAAEPGEIPDCPNDGE